MKCKPKYTHKGIARQRKDGTWWLATRNETTGRWIHHWPIANPAQIGRPGRIIEVIKRPTQNFCIIPAQLELFNN